MRNDTLNKADPTPDAAAIRKLLHDVSNSVHSIVLSAELARLHLDNNDAGAAAKALDRVLDERDNCNELLGRIRNTIAGM